MSLKTKFTTHLCSTKNVIRIKLNVQESETYMPSNVLTSGVSLCRTILHSSLDHRIFFFVIEELDRNQKAT